jgi:hypothetical protein
LEREKKWYSTIKLTRSEKVEGGQVGEDERRKETGSAELNDI